jgi:hypothetical protein
MCVLKITYHSFRSLSYDMYTASFTGTFPQSAVSYFLFQFLVPTHFPRSSSSCLRLTPRTVVSFIFPSITCFGRQFLRNTWPIQLDIRRSVVSRIFFPSLTSCISFFLALHSKWDLAVFSGVSRPHADPHTNGRTPLDERSDGHSLPYPHNTNRNALKGFRTSDFCRAAL